MFLLFTTTNSNRFNLLARKYNQYPLINLQVQTTVHFTYNQSKWRSLLGESWDPFLASNGVCCRIAANGFLFRSDICKIILAVVFPPLGVFLEKGCGRDLLFNIIFTCLGYLPGIIHALYVHLPSFAIGVIASRAQNTNQTLSYRYIIFKY